MVSDCKTFAHKGCKIAAQQNICFFENFPLLTVFFVIGATKHIGLEIICLPYAGFFFLIFFNFDGKHVII